MSPRLTVEEIVAAVSAEFGIDHTQIMRRHRTAPVVRARQVAMWLTVKLTRLPMAAIGRAFGRDRTTIRHALRTIEAALAVGAPFALKGDELRYRFMAGVHAVPPAPCLPEPRAFGHGIALTRQALGYLRDFRDNSAARRLLVEALGYLDPETADHREAA